MSVIALFSDLSAHLRSPEFLQAARHPLHPMAFTRSRKLPLPALVALMLTGMHRASSPKLRTTTSCTRQSGAWVYEISPLVTGVSSVVHIFWRSTTFYLIPNLYRVRILSFHRNSAEQGANSSAESRVIMTL